MVLLFLLLQLTCDINIIVLGLRLSFHCKAIFLNVNRAANNSQPAGKWRASILPQYEPGTGHLPVLHTQGIHVNDSVLVAAQDVV